MDYRGANYLEMLSNHGLLPGHRLNTRVKSCIDHVMVNIDPTKYSATIAVIETTITDHLMTLFNIYSNSKSTVSKNTKTMTDFPGALKTLQELNLSKLLSIEQPENLAQEIVNTISKSLEQNTKTINVPHNKRIIKPWITTGILKCINNRNKLQKQLKSDPTNTILQITYRRYRNYCNNLLKKLKRQYEREQLAKTKSNNKLLWNTIKTITNLNVPNQKIRT